MAEVTILITPRDRYSGIGKCIENLYRCTPEPFKLVVVDNEYPKEHRKDMERAVAGKPNATIVQHGLAIPMESLAMVLPEVDTPYLMHLDNDSDVTPGWLAPILETFGETGAAIVNPLTMERAGVDVGADLRCHLYTSDIRVVEVDGTPYLIENKHFRRALYDQIPKEIRPCETFELHGVVFETAALKQIDIPKMTIREHIDISMQIQAMGRTQVTDPRSIIEFDNLGTRAEMADLRYFDLRWNRQIMQASSDLFFKRWGYRFYSEQFMYNWAVRRRLFLILNHFHVPGSVANKAANAYQKFFLKQWEPLKDPVAVSEHFYSTLAGGKPVRLDK